jgi:hypothetical protein
VTDWDTAMNFLQKVGTKKLVCMQKCEIVEKLTVCDPCCKPEKCCGRINFAVFVVASGPQN